MTRSPILFVLILFITFPVWIAIGGLIFGLLVGLFGLAFGMIGAIIGIFFGILGGVFHFIFGIGSWHHFGPHHLLFNKYVFLALIIFVALVLNKRSRRTN